MLHLPPIVGRIRALLAEDTEASVTYAALEARLALEKVCYDRLRQRHDYISHKQLRKWQPGAVVTTLMEQVDPHVADTMTLQISKSPAGSGMRPEDQEYVELGTQIGFNARRIAKQWQALAKLALHVKLPENKTEEIPNYGDREQIKSKVEEVIADLERLSAGSMAFSGIGGEVSWECQVCGEKSKRRAALLREGQRVFCINPDCEASWLVRKEGQDFVFEGETCDFACQGCGHVMPVPWRFFFEKLKFGDRAIIDCRQCNHRNYVEWRLSQVAPAADRDA
jgi:hypothetical protein